MKRKKIYLFVGIACVVFILIGALMIIGYYDVSRPFQYQLP